MGFIKSHLCQNGLRDIAGYVLVATFQHEKTFDSDNVTRGACTNIAECRQPCKIWIPQLRYRSHLLIRYR
jgi:hypothetical protein